MKNKIFLTIFVMLILFKGYSSNITSNSIVSNVNHSFFFRHIDKTYHSTNGYTIRIVGELNHTGFFTSWSFSGKVYITGNGQSIVLNLELTSPKPVPDICSDINNNFEYASVDISGNGTSATSCYWTTSNQIASDVLNSSEIIEEFLIDVNFETFN